MRCSSLFGLCPPRVVMPVTPTPSPGKALAKFDCTCIPPVLLVVLSCPICLRFVGLGGHLFVFFFWNVNVLAGSTDGACASASQGAEQGAELLVGAALGAASVSMAKVHSFLGSFALGLLCMFPTHINETL